MGRVMAHEPIMQEQLRADTLRAVEDNVTKVLDAADHLHQLVLYRQLYTLGFRISDVPRQIDHEVARIVQERS